MKGSKAKKAKKLKNIPVEDQILKAIENDTMVCGEIDMVTGKITYLNPKK